ncbi:hypothetical protein [Sinimarinibacterium flocculans]|uniref:hypothetical protein n=1 Tax=Sinimarinibacterium flocculans TaxID=985250 RepID=UPI0035183733
MTIATKTRRIRTAAAGHAFPESLFDGLQYCTARLLYALLGAVGVMMWMLMQLPLGSRARSTLVTTMAGCVGMFALGWRLLSEQAAGLRRSRV